MKKQEIIIKTEFQNITLEVRPNKEHKWLLSTQEVAEGYGVSEITIRRHKNNKQNEFKENKHYLRVQNMNAQNYGIKLGSMVREETYWTKRGVARLGFFIKSERAIAFRDWAEDLIINHLESKNGNLETLKNELKQELKDEILNIQNQLIHNLKQDLLEATQTFIHTQIEENNQTQMYRYWEYLQGVFELLDQRLKNIEPPKIETNTKKAYVYVFQKIDTEEYKIGKSIQTLKRLQRVQTNAGNKIQLIIAIDMPNEATALKLEEYLHFVFEEKRIIGEWFRLNQADLNLIQTIAQGFENYKFANQ